MHMCYTHAHMHDHSNMHLFTLKTCAQASDDDEAPKKPSGLAALFSFGGGKPKQPKAESSTTVKVGC